MDADYSGDKSTTIVDALLGPAAAPGPFRLTADQRRYFSYGWHEPSADAERASPRIAPRHFRSLRERRSDPTNSGMRGVAIADHRHWATRAAIGTDQTRQATTPAPFSPALR